MTLQKQIDRLIALQAAEWFERINGGEPDAHEEFMAWLAESPRHMEAFMAIASEAPAIRAAFQSGRFDRAALLRRVASNVHRLEPPVAEQTNAPSEAQRRVRPWHWMALATAASVIAITVAIGAREIGWRDFDTGVGEQRRIQLADGSEVLLNARSHLEVKLGEAERQIRLEGEALFKVAHESNRPFRVHTQRAVVQAVGTEFNVYARADGSTRVSVLEGKVRVTPETASLLPVLTLLPLEAPKFDPLPLAAGEEAEVAKGGDIQRTAGADVSEAVAWQRQKLIFRHTSLEDMVEEFNRYNAVQFRLEGIEPGVFRYTGAFDADDPQSLAQLLAREPDLVVEHADGEIWIRARKPAM